MMESWLRIRNVVNLKNALIFVSKKSRRLATMYHCCFVEPVTKSQVGWDFVYDKICRFVTDYVFLFYDQLLKPLINKRYVKMNCRFATNLLLKKSRRDDVLLS